MIGECLLTSIYNAERSCYEPRIDNADSHILISDEILRDAFWNNNPWISIRRPIDGHGSTAHSVGEYNCYAPAGSVCFHDALVTLKATNRSVVYRIGRYMSEIAAWEAHWPD